MRKHGPFTLVFAALLLSPVAAAAQEKGQVGVFMGYPSLGLVWQATERIGVRPEIGFSSGSGETELSESSSSSVSLGASILFYAAKRENAALYFAPRYAYSHSTSEFESTSPFGGDGALKIKSNSSQLSGSVGAQYWLGKRFSLFGEAGIQYTWGNTDNDSAFSGLTSGSDSHVFGTRSSVAVIWYF